MSNIRQLAKAPHLLDEDELIDLYNKVVVATLAEVKEFLGDLDVSSCSEEQLEIIGVYIIEAILDIWGPDHFDEFLPILSRLAETTDIIEYVAPTRLTDHQDEVLQSLPIRSDG